jgi:predicted RNA-binding protein with PUA-like domain
MKSEPNEGSFSDLKNRWSIEWFGVRNYQARNMMKNEMKKGDIVLFYHSSCALPGIAWLACIAREALPDETQFQDGKYFDSRATHDIPIWFCVRVKFFQETQFIPLKTLRSMELLSDLKILQKGNRLSITPISQEHYSIIEKML